MRCFGWMKYQHIPVMLNEAIEYLNIKSGHNYIDCTLGGGGYSREIAQRVGEKGAVLSLDMDELAIQNIKKIINNNKISNIFVAHENFRNLRNAINENWPPERSARFSGVVYDLGLSSAQLQDRTRGISFQLDAPLDMAFGQNNKFIKNSTEEIVNNFRPHELEKIIKDYGEERYAKFIADGIFKARKVKRIKTTKELLEIIAQAVPPSYQKNKKIHYATRTFQALRIATNLELENLPQSLKEVLDILDHQARIVVISYHSLEDRIVKNFFRTESRDCICGSEAPICNCQHHKKIKIITKKIITPKLEEVKNNPRARSAKMRVAEKL